MRAGIYLHVHVNRKNFGCRIANVIYSWPAAMKSHSHNFLGLHCACASENSAIFILPCGCIRIRERLGRSVFHCAFRLHIGPRCALLSLIILVSFCSSAPSPFNYSAHEENGCWEPRACEHSQTHRFASAVAPPGHCFRSARIIHFD